MNTLSEADISAKLQDMDVDWQLVNGTVLRRLFKFANFAEALAFVNSLGDLAEEMNHHPDIQLSWGKVTVSITTHSLGGLTDLDFTFAQCA